MKLPATLAVLALLCLLPPREPHPGPLLVAGGGGMPEAVLATALERAGGLDARVVVVPFASRTEDRGASSVEMWRAAGAREIVNLDGLEPDRMRGLVAAADLVWLSGGSQARLVEALIELDLLEAVRARHAEGALVGGTSAGAAVMSATMLTGEADLESIRAGTTATAPGLGLWPGVIVDQHFLARRRNNRLLAVVLDHMPRSVGVGIDERTAVLVEPDGELTVLGEGQVVIYDARAAKRAEAKPGELHQVSGVTLHVLRAGARLDLDP